MQGKLVGRAACCPLSSHLRDATLSRQPLWEAEKQEVELFLGRQSPQLGQALFSPSRGTGVGGALGWAPGGKCTDSVFKVASEAEPGTKGRLDPGGQGSSEPWFVWFFSGLKLMLNKILYVDI